MVPAAPRKISHLAVLSGTDDTTSVALTPVSTEGMPRTTSLALVRESVFVDVLDRIVPHKNVIIS